MWYRSSAAIQKYFNAESYVLAESYVQIAPQQFSRYWFCVLIKDTLAGEIAADVKICRSINNLFSYGTVS